MKILRGQERTKVLDRSKRERVRSKRMVELQEQREGEGQRSRATFWVAKGNQSSLC